MQNAPSEGFGDLEKVGVAAPLKTAPPSGGGSASREWPGLGMPFTASSGESPPSGGVLACGTRLCEALRGYSKRSPSWGCRN